AVRDLTPGPVRGAVLADNSDVSAEVLDEVPLGHKFALRDLGAGTPVIEYSVQVAVTTAPIKAGNYVHTHNVRSARWQNSVAN
ncbi:MAG: UxaA family hydrolase, partial [Mycobacteriales bacterium]